MFILGICAYHGDSSACLIHNGKIVAAAEEERFTRIKHWAGFPEMSIRYCLREAGIPFEEIDTIAMGKNTKSHLFEKGLFVLKHRQSLRKLSNRFRHLRNIGGIAEIIAERWSLDKKAIKTKIVNVEHHLAHMASSFMVSPFENAAICSMDGFGDFVSSYQGLGDGNRMRVLNQVMYPHSIGQFYTMITQFLGFNKYGDEFKVMGLAAFGEPRMKKKLGKIISYTGDGQYRLNLDYFRHHSEGVEMIWDGSEPIMGRVYSEKFVRDFGAPRNPKDDLTDYHKDLASSLQEHTEDIIFAVLKDLYRKTENKKLCLAGGVAMNSVANGKIFDNTDFEDIYIQSAAGDAGISLGAAYYVYNQMMGNPREFVMESSYWGPGFSNDDIRISIEKYHNEIKTNNCSIDIIDDPTELCKKTAVRMASGAVVGWFQGKMEWGPRALGNRSIVVDPTRPDMVDILNTRIKRRESFRPFAPSILLEATGEYFEKDYPDPFMLKVYSIRPDKRDKIPAVVHVDGTGRLQTVSKKENPLYYKLIKEFEALTGIPIILNTSFNENEPIVCTPENAFDCFFRTKMDTLVIGCYIVTRKNGNSK